MFAAATKAWKMHSYKCGQHTLIYVACNDDSSRP